MKLFSGLPHLGYLAAAALFTCVVVSVCAQGTLNFGNSTGTRLTNTTGANFPPAGSTTYKAGLYWGIQGTPEASLTVLPSASNGVTTTWPISGIFSGGTASFPVPGGTTIAVQVRVWTATYADYAGAIAGALSGDLSVLFGKGIIQTLTLGNAGDPPSPPQDLATPSGGGTPFRGMGIYSPLISVPEPSSIALGLLGLAAVVLLRRRK